MNSQFYMKTRNGKVSLWIGEWNIWDLLPKEVTPNVMMAIQHAFSLGKIVASQAIGDALLHIAVVEFPLPEWQDMRKEASDE